MDLLERLGYTKTTGEPFWGGPAATSLCTYDQMSGLWPSNNPPLSGKDVFEATWETIVDETVAVEYKEQRVISGYIEIPDQLDMLYWDVYSGVFGDEAKSSTWFQHCSGVKEQFPKP